MLMRADRVTASAPPAPTVVVLGGDAIVGHALELLLRGSGYDATYEDVQIFGTRRSLAKVGLVLLAPGLDEWDRDAVSASIEAVCRCGSLPVLELTSPVTTFHPRKKHALVSWPCRTEDLEREIEAALLRKECCVAGNQDLVGVEKDRS
jgi:hypothetical protein